MKRFRSWGRSLRTLVLFALLPSFLAVPAVAATLWGAFSWGAASWEGGGGSGAIKENYTYDALGRLTGVTTPTGVLTYSYDAAGNRTSTTTTALVLTSTLSANPSSIMGGSPTTLSWTSANATSASIDNGVGNVTPVLGGSVTVTPSATTTYTLTVVDSAGATARSSTTVTVNGSPTASLAASSGSILRGNSATLSWTSTNASSTSIDNGVGNVLPVSSGSIAVSPTSTTIYTLTATGAGGATATSSTTINVNQLPTANLVATPPSILAGDQTSLSWTNTNASSASINNGVGDATPVGSGSRMVSPGSTTTYTLTALGALGSSATSPATVTVYPRPTGSLSASPISIAPGAASTLSWTTTNATGTSIDNGVGGVSPASSGSIIVRPSATTTYTLTTTGALGSTVTSQATVTVSAENHPPVAYNQYIAIPGPLSQVAYGSLDPRQGDSDPDGDNLTIVGITQPALSTVHASYTGTGVTIWGPVENYSTTMTYTISDGRGGQATATINIDFQPDGF